MGFYVSTDLVDQHGNLICRINTEKYSIGLGYLCFEKEDCVLDIPNHVFYYKTPVQKAQKRVQKYYREILNIKNKKILEGVKYDTWSEETIQKAIEFMEKLFSYFNQYESEYVFADFQEASYLYESNEEVAVCDGESSMRFLRMVLDGCFIGRHPDEQLWKEAMEFIQSFKEKLLQFNGILSIENFGTSYEPSFFKLGNQRLMKFQMDIQLSENSIEENYEIFDVVMNPIRPFFLEHGCDFERNFKEDWVTKEGKVRIIVYKLI